jgi:hypothetical protein
LIFKDFLTGKRENGLNLQNNPCLFPDKHGMAQSNFKIAVRVHKAGLSSPFYQKSLCLSFKECPEIPDIDQRPPLARR